MVDPKGEQLVRVLKRCAIAAGLVFGLILVGGSFVRLAKGKEVRAWTSDSEIPTVAVFEPERISTPQVLILPGTLRAYYNAQMYSRVPGYVQNWYRDIGATVRKGELLATIDTPELDQQLAQAQADLDMSHSAKTLSEITAHRWEVLLPLDAVSKQASQEKSEDVSAKSSAVRAASANLHRLQAMKGFGRIVAPFDGVVTTRNVDVGALVSGGPVSGSEPLFAVSDIHRLRAYVHVPQSYSAQITHGIASTLSVPEYSGRTFQAELVSTSSAISSESGTLLVELQVDNPDGALKPGGYAEVRLSLPAKQDRLTVPASALMFRSAGLQVATVDPSQRIVMKPVQIVRDLGAKVEIATGLDPRDRIVDNPPDSLTAGDMVRVAADGHAP